jgi:hypothetical protein
MPANPEYLLVLSKVVECIRGTLDHASLPPLSPEQTTEWLHSMTIEDVKAVWKEDAESAAVAEIA